MGSQARGPDYGVFEFGNLFSEAILGHPYQELSTAERSSFTARFEHKVSDQHAPVGAAAASGGLRFLYRVCQGRGEHSAGGPCRLPDTEVEAGERWRCDGQLM